MVMLIFDFEWPSRSLVVVPVSIPWLISSLTYVDSDLFYISGSFFDPQAQHMHKNRSLMKAQGGHLSGNWWKSREVVVRADS